MRDNFQCKLDEIFKTASDAGWPAVVVRSGDVHLMVGGYPHATRQRMPVCCDVMKKIMNQDDEIVRQPPKGRGANLYIRYLLPRDNHCCRAC